MSLEWRGIICVSCIGTVTLSKSQGCNSNHLLWLSMLDGPLLLWVNLAVVLPSGVKITATGESKLNDSPEIGK